MSIGEKVFLIFWELCIIWTLNISGHLKASEEIKDLILVKVIKTGSENLSLKYLESVNFNILLTSDPYIPQKN